MNVKLRTTALLILVISLVIPGCESGQRPGSTSTPTLTSTQGLTPTIITTSSATSTSTPIFTPSPAYTVTPILPPITYQDLFVFKNYILNITPPPMYDVTATCGYLQCTKDYVYTLTGPLKGSYYKYHLMANEAILNLRILFSPNGTTQKMLLAEWDEQTGLDGYQVGMPFEGRYGDKIILEMDLPSGQFNFTYVYRSQTSYISIGDRENAPIQPTSTPIPTSETWKNVRLIYVNGSQPMANKAVAFAYYYKNNWLFISGLTDAQGAIQFRLPLQDSGQSCNFAFGDSKTDLYMNSAHNTLLYYRTPADYTQTDLVFQVDENSKVTLLEGRVETFSP